MIIFGLNLPLPEIFFVLVFLFLIFLIIILYQLQRLQRMTSEERQEIAELEKLAQEEKSDLEQIKIYETMESADLSKFEKGIMELEEDTDTLYIKKLAPDVYKVQNYVLWALQKGMSPEQIRQNLLSKGWKDSKLVEMVINDMLKYKGYYVENKGKVEIPEMRTEDKSSEERVKVIKIIEKPVVIHHRTAVIRTKTIKPKKAKKSKKKAKAAKPKKPKKAAKKAKKSPKKDEFSDVEKQLEKLEKDLTKEGKKKIKEEGKELKSETKPVVKKTEKVKPVKKSQKPSKTSTLRPPKEMPKKKTKAVKAGKKETSVTLQADKGVDVHVKYK